MTDEDVAHEYSDEEVAAMVERLNNRRLNYHIDYGDHCLMSGAQSILQSLLDERRASRDH